MAEPTSDLAGAAYGQPEVQEDLWELCALPWRRLSLPPTPPHPSPSCLSAPERRAPTHGGVPGDPTGPSPLPSSLAPSPSSAAGGQELC